MMIVIYESKISHRNGKIDLTHAEKENDNVARESYREIVMCESA